jgi:putative flippase GtrA
MRGLVAFVKHVLSHDAGPFWQFVKYGAVGVMATCVQVGVFYLLATTCLKCLAADDWAVRLLGFSAADVSDAVRAWRFAVATGIGFVIANVFCWLMNRWFVFRPGKFRWYIEFVMFFGAATLATVIALGLSSGLIHFVGLMTSAAVLIEIVASFLINYFTRKFFIFRG